MNLKQFLTGIFASFGMLMLITDGKTALTGAQIGIDLCVRTVIPSLFPFFILSILITSSFPADKLSILSPVRKLCSVPIGAEAILLSGFLGGYPVGAQAVSSAYCAGQLNKETANRMLAFCSNAGPAFLFGMVASVLSDSYSPFLLWGIHIGSAVLVAAILPSVSVERTTTVTRPPVSLSSAMHTALTVMATVCGWVILFRVIIAFLERWVLWMLPSILRIIVIGFLELSNGCCEIGSISDPELQFVVCSGVLAWGGLCVTMQTASVIGELSIKTYLTGKLLQLLFSLLISTAVVLTIWFPVCVFLLLLAAILRKTQKRSRNPATLVV